MSRKNSGPTLPRSNAQVIAGLRRARVSGWKIRVTERAADDRIGLLRGRPNRLSTEPFRH